MARLAGHTRVSCPDLCDDRIQESTTGRIEPESWTHGSAEQRVAWFTTGYRSGNTDDCDTFAQ